MRVQFILLIFLFCFVHKAQARSSDSDNSYSRWGKVEWKNYLESEINKSIDSISWWRLGRLFKNPSALASLKANDMEQCTQRYREMVEYRNLVFEADKTFGLPKYEYYERAEAKYPHIFDLPPELENGFPRDLEALVKSKEKEGWELLWRKHGGENRFIMHVPSTQYGYDQWYNVGVHQEDTSTPFVVAQITVIKKEEVVDGTKIKKYTPFLIERVSSGWNDSINKYQRRITGQCRQCHISGVHNVFIGDGMGPFISVPEKSPDEQRLAMNKTLNSYGTLDWGEWYHPEKLGPPLSLEDAGLGEVSSREDCATCHDGDTRGILNLAAMTKHIRQKIYDGTMPPSKTRRFSGSTIYSALMNSYPKKLVEWVSLKSCFKE